MTSQPLSPDALRLSGDCDNLLPGERDVLRALAGRTRRDSLKSNENGVGVEDVEQEKK